MSQALIRNDGINAPYLLFMLQEQMFGIRVEDVQSVEELENLTYVPLAGDHIGGVLQMHGHIITAINMRAALNLPANTEDSGKKHSFIVERDNHQYCILIDKIVGVFDLSIRESDKVPDTIDHQLKKIATNVLRHDGHLVLATTASTLMTTL